MDKRNQIGCEDTTKLSAEGVTFDLRPTAAATTKSIYQGELQPSLGAEIGFADLSAPTLRSSLVSTTE